MPTPMHPLILAVDLGTSGPKVGLVAGDGHILGHEFEPTRLHLLPDGGAEQDPEDWWRAIVAATHRLLAQDLAPREAIAGISITSQWSGTVPVDRDGRALCRAIIWMDARGADAVRRLTGGLLSIQGYRVDKLWTWLRLTGGIPGHSGKDSIAHILFIKDQFPEIYRQTYKFLEPKDYLNLRLTGQFAASPDSITLHWVTDNRDINNVRYSEQLIRMCGIDGDKLPPLKPAIDSLGVIKPDVAQELGLGEDVQVIMGTPDVHSAAVGSGAVRDFEPHLYIGTSSWLTCHVPFKKTDLFHNMASLPSALPGRYFIVNEQETAGACLAFIRDNILYHEDELASEAPRADVFQLFDRVIEKVPPGSDGVIFTPWLNGERTPVDDHLVRGGFHNLSLKTTRLHFLRAVFEGVAFNSRWLLTYVEKFAGRRFDQINMIGGGANSDVWCQVHADVLNRPICQVKDPIQANTRGAALLAAVGLGYVDVKQIPNCVEILKTYKPDPANRAVYDEMYRSYVQLYNQTHKIYARLNAAR